MSPVTAAHPTIGGDAPPAPPRGGHPPRRAADNDVLGRPALQPDGVHEDIKQQGCQGEDGRRQRGGRPQERERKRTQPEGQPPCAPPIAGPVVTSSSEMTRGLVSEM